MKLAALLAGVAAAGCAMLAAADAATPPHIVLLLIDELGVGDMPWADPLLHAPTLQSLGENGLRLGHTYAWHWCAPTRGALLSGRLPMHSGYGDGFGRPPATLLGMPGDGPGMDLRMPLLPEELRRAGYATAMLGKWHLGFRSPRNLPTSRGFDSYLGLLGGGSDHYRKTLCVPGSDHSIHGLCPCADPPDPPAAGSFGSSSSAEPEDGVALCSMAGVWHGHPGTPNHTHINPFAIEVSQAAGSHAFFLVNDGNQRGSIGADNVTVKLGTNTGVLCRNVAVSTTSGCLL